jgi:hypothetical protein
MTLELTLPSELEERLRREAERRGLSPDGVVLQLLDRHLPSSDRRAGTAALLQSWIDADEADAADADYDLFQALDEARTSNRKLFPDDLKGVSW